MCSQFGAALITSDPNDPLLCIPGKNPIVFHYNASYSGSKFTYSQDSDSITVNGKTYESAAYEQTDTIHSVIQNKGAKHSVIKISD